jgi:hypothetical protein
MNSSIKFHCGYSERDGHKDEFCFKRRCEERMAKECAGSTTLPMVYLSLVCRCPGPRRV